jgi:acyl-CoA thioester hydrolase
MTDAALIFKDEMYYGDELKISVQPVECNRVGFDLIYKIEKIFEGKVVTVAIAKTAMVCYDYSIKKIISLPETAKSKLQS